MNRRLAATFVVALAVFIAAHFLDFRGSVPRFEKVTGGGVLLDMTPSFTDDALYARLTGYGEAGRAEYAFRNVTVDILLPLGLLPFLLLLMHRALRPFSPRRMWRGLLYAIPAAYVVFDLVENASVLILLQSFPARVPLVAAMLPYVTLVKRAFSILALLLPLVILLATFVRSRFRSLQSAP